MQTIPREISFDCGVPAVNFHKMKALVHGTYVTSKIYRALLKRNIPGYNPAGNLLAESPYPNLTSAYQILRDNEGLIFKYPDKDKLFIKPVETINNIISFEPNINIINNHTDSDTSSDAESDIISMKPLSYADEHSENDIIEKDLKYKVRPPPIAATEEDFENLEYTVKVVDYVFENIEWIHKNRFACKQRRVLLALEKVHYKLSSKEKYRPCWSYTDNIYGIEFLKKKKTAIMLDKECMDVLRKWYESW